MYSRGSSSSRCGRRWPRRSRRASRRCRGEIPQSGRNIPFDGILSVMSSQRFAPLPIFRSPAQAKLLTHLYVTARDEPLSLSALSERTEIPLSTVQREIDRLEKAGLVTSERLGQTRRVYANNDSPYFVEMRSLLLKAFGPVPLLANLLQRIPRIAASYIYGSWARRYRGEAGSPPRDL